MMSEKSIVGICFITNYNTIVENTMDLLMSLRSMRTHGRRVFYG